jgi:hypothetical protein
VLTIPQAEPEPEPAVATEPAAAIAVAPTEQPAPPKEAERPVTEATNEGRESLLPGDHPLGELVGDEDARPGAAELAGEPGGFEGLELIYDSPPARAAVAAPPVAADMISIPRYAIYLQGGLLAVVAFFAFIIGLLAGGTVLRGPPTAAVPQPCTISGSITYTSGPRQLPDEGAVVAVIPQSPERPDEKAPIEGLRPGDPTPGAEHRGIAILRQLGGGYARADSGGRFQIQVPRQGRYLVLVISRERAIRSANEIDTADILKLGPYFANAADLLGDRRYELSQETLRGDKQLQVAF